MLTCPVCGEVWERSSLADNDRGFKPGRAFVEFQTQGCGSLFDGVPCQEAGQEQWASFQDWAEDHEDELEEMEMA